jgi:hypothetical protein
MCSKDYYERLKRSYLQRIPTRRESSLIFSFVRNKKGNPTLIALISLSERGAGWQTTIEDRNLDEPANLTAIAPPQQ